MVKYIITMLLLTVTLTAQVKFDDYFLDKTLRLDYYHSGTNVEDIYTFDELIEEPYWGGSKTNLVDELNLGNFMVMVYDDATDKLIYSRGFSTLFWEWQTTAEAKQYMGTMSESVVFPYPKNKVRVEIHDRDEKNNFKKVWAHDVDPNSYFIREEQKLKFDNFKVHYSGDPAVKYDIVFLPEGYTKEELPQFKAKVQELTDSMFNYIPFGEYKDKINVWGVDAYSKETGTDIPGDDIWKNTVLNSNFYTFDSERYIMTEDFKAVRDVASNAPYDQIVILANSPKYGGGAIYNFYTLTVANHAVTELIFMHEIGHGLAGLADEYEGDVSYEDFYPTDVEPWEPNITTLVDFDSKWKHMLNEDTPIPTPETEANENVIGVYEGGGYAKEGVYRFRQQSIMNTLSEKRFYEVSEAAIRKIIDFYAE